MTIKTYIKHPPANIDCKVHGAESPATTHLRADGTPRYRCKRCHAEKEKARRHANLMGNRNYRNAYGRMRKLMEEGG